MFYQILHDKKLNTREIRKIKKKFSQIDLVVIRYSNSGLRMSKPCSRCLYILKKLGVNSVYYSTENGVLIREKVKNMETSHICQSDLSGLI